jgi:hypothetical protein
MKTDKRGMYGSMELGIVVLRRSWREMFLGKRGMATKQE